MDNAQVGDLVKRITGMGVIVSIEQDEGYWFASVFDREYNLTGIAEYSSVLETALERVEHRLLTEK